MGAQAAALLDAGGPVGDLPGCDVPGGDVPGGDVYDGQLDLAPVPGFVLAATALLHSGVGLAPTAWDGARLHLRLGPSAVVVDAGLHVRWRGPRPDVAVLRRVLDLDADHRELWAACDRVPSLAGLRPFVLRSPSVWQDLVGTLAGTRASYRSTQAMVRDLVGAGAFPDPAAVLAADTSRWGYRAPYLRAIAERVEGGWDPETLLLPERSDADVAAEVRALPGFGPFATAQLQPLLGRPRPPVLDGWLADRLAGVDLARYAPMGRWAGTGAWLEAVAPRLRRLSGAVPPP